MLYILYDEKREFEAECVRNMCGNSFSKRNVQKILYKNLSVIPDLAVLICPNDDVLTALQNKNGKYLLLGTLSERWMDFFELERKKETYDLVLEEHDGIKISDMHVIYHKEVQGISKVIDRPLVRYDYMDEWNNHSYGKIEFNRNAFSLAEFVCSSPWEIASVVRSGNEHISAYACLKNKEQASFFWFNRPVGPVDSLEWNIVERYFANYESEKLPCIPYLLDIPVGYQGACTMRLDCDLAIESAHYLAELYADKKVPLSLAVVTGNHISENDYLLMDLVVKNGGSILSHSMNHFPEWGGNYLGAYMEALGSKLWMKQRFHSEFHDYVVSPFHQNPQFAVKALRDVGYKGFVSGSIHHDPEFLMARGGCVPFIDGIVSLSQQCMIHGDCYHGYGNSITPYKECLDMFVEAHGIFGFLDHPLADSYQYGWVSLDEQVNVHEEFLDYALSLEDIWFCNLSDALDFEYLKARECLNILSKGKKEEIDFYNESSHQWNIGAIYKDEVFSKY